MIPKKAELSVAVLLKGLAQYGEEILDFHKQCAVYAFRKAALSICNLQSASCSHFLPPFSLDCVSFGGVTVWLPPLHFQMRQIS